MREIRHVDGVRGARRVRVSVWAIRRRVPRGHRVRPRYARHQGGVMRYDLDDLALIGERAVVVAVVLGWLALMVLL